MVDVVDTYKFKGPQTARIMLTAAKASNFGVGDFLDGLTELVVAGARGTEIKHVDVLPQTTLLADLFCHLHIVGPNKNASFMVDSMTVPNGAKVGSGAYRFALQDWTLDPNHHLYVGMSTAIASGVVFWCQYQNALSVPGEFDED